MAYQQQQSGTISQLNQGQLGGGQIGESVVGSQRVVQNASHWWVQHPEDEPLPGCNIPVRHRPSAGEALPVCSEGVSGRGSSSSGPCSYRRSLSLARCAPPPTTDDDSPRAPRARPAIGTDGFRLCSPTTQCSARLSMELLYPLPFASCSVCPRAPSGVVRRLRPSRKPPPLLPRRPRWPARRSAKRSSWLLHESAHTLFMLCAAHASCASAPPSTLNRPETYQHHTKEAASSIYYVSELVNKHNFAMRDSLHYKRAAASSGKQRSEAQAILTNLRLHARAASSSSFESPTAITSSACCRARSLLVRASASTCVRLQGTQSLSEGECEHMCKAAGHAVS